jgi:glutamate racemase
MPLKESGIDTLVLGCTHYPLLTGALSFVMGDQVTLVSSAEETAKDVYRTLVEHKIERTAKTPPTLVFKATGDAKSFEALAHRFLGPEVKKVEEIR